MTKSYLITLTSTGKFFFGGDMAFTVNGEKTDFTSYIIKSNRFPQQTSLLGMLRFLILSNAGENIFADNQIVDSDEAAKIIGPTSFCVNGKKNDYGKIVSISPCFIIDGDKPEKIKVLGSEYDFELANGVLKSADYKAKEGLMDNYECYFIEDLRIGLLKEPEGKKRKAEDEDDALFKQVNLRFNNAETHDYKFAFYAEVDEQIDLSAYTNQLVSLGADSSIFIIGISEEMYKGVEIVRGGIKCEHTVVLTSPAYIELDRGTKVLGITETIPFRFLQSNVNNIKYSKLNSELKTSGKFNMYDRGSVFVFGSKTEKEEFCKKLESYEDFRQIGYNYYE